MATFLQDLEVLLQRAHSISRLRSRKWSVRYGALIDWQSSVFDSLLRFNGDGSVSSAYLKLFDSSDTKEPAILLHNELVAINIFIQPLADFPYAIDENENNAEEQPSSPRIGWLRQRAMALIKMFLESLKEILGDFLGARAKAGVQLAIEAAGAFA